MTNSAIEAAERETYSVLKYERKGRFVAWATKIGYHTPGKTADEIRRNRERGVRVRSWQYHGKDYAAAQRARSTSGRSGKRSSPNTERRKPCTRRSFAETAAARANGYYMVGDEQVPFREDELLDLLNESAPPPPVWPTNEDVNSCRPKFELASARREPGTRPKQGEITIEKAKELYVAAYGRHVGLKSGAGLKPRSASQHEKNLGLALRALDPTTPVSSLDKAMIESVALYWSSPARGIRTRTAANYVSAFHQFIRRLPLMGVGFVLPQIDDTLFRFRKTKGVVLKYDPEQLKTLLHALDDECKLFQLLALNCGFYQVDIFNLRRDQVVALGGEWFIVRSRDKTSHQNDFASQWWLFPETAELLKRHMAQPNKLGLALLRPDGTSMAYAGKSNDDYVTARFLENIVLPVPPLSEQMKIVEVLDSWRQTADSMARLLKLKRRLKRGLMQQLLDGHHRFSKFGERPWEEMRITPEWPQRDGFRSSRLRPDQLGEPVDLSQ